MNGAILPGLFAGGWAFRPVAQALISGSPEITRRENKPGQRWVTPSTSRDTACSMASLESRPNC